MIVRPPRQNRPQRLPGFLPRPAEIVAPMPTPTIPGTVSIIIPAYQATHTIGECLQSCQQQTRPADEIVVVDDGSTDGTLEMARRFHAGGARLTLVRLEINRGAAAARNIAIRRARGEFVVFVDADDLAPPDRVEVTMGLFCETGAGMIYGQKELFDFDVDRRRAAPRASPPDPRNIIGASGCGAQAMATRRSIHIEEGVWLDESMPVAEDAEFLVACLFHSIKVHSAPLVVCWQRMSGGSLRHRGNWPLMRRWIRVKHRGFLEEYVGRPLRWDVDEVEEALEARRVAGWS